MIQEKISPILDINDNRPNIKLKQTSQNYNSNPTSTKDEPMLCKLGDLYFDDALIESNEEKDVFKRLYNNHTQSSNIRRKSTACKLEMTNNPCSLFKKRSKSISNINLPKLPTSKDKKSTMNSYFHPSKAFFNNLLLQSTLSLGRNHGTTFTDSNINYSNASTHQVDLSCSQKIIKWLEDSEPHLTIEPDLNQ